MQSRIKFSGFRHPQINLLLIINRRSRTQQGRREPDRKAETMQNKIPTARHTFDKQNYKKDGAINLKNRYKAITTGKLANGFTKELASEALPVGPLAGAKPGSEPVEGTTEVVPGTVVPAPSD